MVSVWQARKTQRCYDAMYFTVREVFYNSLKIFSMVLKWFFVCSITFLGFFFIFADILIAVTLLSTDSILVLPESILPALAPRSVGMQLTWDGEANEALAVKWVSQLQPFLKHSWDNIHLLMGHAWYALGSSSSVLLLVKSVPSKIKSWIIWHFMHRRKIPLVSDRRKCLPRIAPCPLSLVSEGACWYLCSVHMKVPLPETADTAVCSPVLWDPAWCILAATSVGLGQPFLTSARRPLWLHFAP